MMHAVERAVELGFDLAATIEPGAISCEPSLRELCNPPSCEHYGTSWSCPPGAGTLEECAARVAACGSGVLVQTVRDNVDFSDTARLDAIRDEHNGRLDLLARDLRQAHGRALEFTTGGCSICSPCSYPEKPCHQPERQRLALSAHGIDVAKLCDRAGMDYAFENGTIRFVGLILC